MGQNNQQSGQADHNPNENPGEQEQQRRQLGQDNDQKLGNQAGRDDENLQKR
ncbi:MAG: hypothetical protein JNL35_18430 [Sphingopyxis sp.]|nr:hypothetical protein [Sphingopyxis sp.]